MRRLILGFIVFALATIASAQIVVGPAVFSPSAPTAQDTIEAAMSFASAGCSFDQATTVSGNVVTLTITVYTCLGGPSDTVPVANSFGPLPQGSYNLRVYLQFAGQPQPPTLEIDQPFIVAPAPAQIPMFSPTTILFIALVLVFGGFAAVSKPLH